MDAHCHACSRPLLHGRWAGEARPGSSGSDGRGPCLVYAAHSTGGTVFCRQMRAATSEAASQQVTDCQTAQECAPPALLGATRIDATCPVVRLPFSVRRQAGRHLRCHTHAPCTDAPLHCPDIRPSTGRATGHTGGVTDAHDGQCRRGSVFGQWLRCCFRWVCMQQQEQRARRAVRCGRPGLLSCVQAGFSGV